jgi:WD40 repeat protein
MNMSTRKNWKRYGFLFFAVALPITTYFILAERASWRPKLIIALQNIADFAVTKDGKFLIVAVNQPPSNVNHLNSEIQVWDLKARKKIRKFKTGLPDLYTLTLDDDGERFAVYGARNCGDSSVSCGRVQIYDTYNFKRLHTSQIIADVEKIAGFVAPDKILVAINAEKAEIWNMRDKAPELTLRTNCGPYFAYSSRHKLIARQYDYHPLEIWDAARQRKLFTHPHIRPEGDECGLAIMAFSPDGKHIAINREKQIQLWNVENGKLAQSFPEKQKDIPEFLTIDSHTQKIMPDGYSFLFSTPTGIYSQRVK